jgi:hypothetical protein
MALLAEDVTLLKGRDLHQLQIFKSTLARLLRTKRTSRWGCHGCPSGSCLEKR